MSTRKGIVQFTFGGGAILTALLLAGEPLRAADDPFSDVKQRYAAAAYEETLAALATLDDPALIDQVDEYRALCLLALHRDEEAERAIERLVLRDPLPLEGLNNRSPKFATLYKSVRNRLVPRLASGSYSAAKASFDARDYSNALRQFDEALALLRSAEDPAALGDLTLLATEFRMLSEQRLTPVDPEPIPEPAPAPTAVAMAEAPAVPAPVPPPVPVSRPFTPVPRVYDFTDRDVTPPVVIDQTLPPWNPPWALAARRTYSGRLQVIVSEEGSVASADILQASFGTYDDLLLQKVKQWRYQPAVKRDHPVQYRRIIEYVLRGAEPASAQR